MRPAHGHNQDEQHMDRRRQFRRASLGRDQRGEEVLPLDADVEQVHLEADGDGGGRKDQRCGSMRHLDELVDAGGLDDRGEVLPMTARMKRRSRERSPPSVATTIRCIWAGRSGQREDLVEGFLRCRARWSRRSPSHAGRSRRVPRGDRVEVEPSISPQEHAYDPTDRSVLRGRPDEQDGHTGVAPADRPRPPGRRRRYRGWVGGGEY